MKLSLKLPLAFLAALLLLLGAALFGIQQLNQALAVYETSVAQSYAQGLRSLSGSRPRPTGWRQGGARHGPGAVEAAGRSRRADRQGQCRHRRPGGPARQPGHHAQPDRDAGRVRCQRGGGAAVQPVGGAHQRQQRGRRPSKTPPWSKKALLRPTVSSDRRGSWLVRWRSSACLLRSRPLPPPTRRSHSVTGCGLGPRGDACTARPAGLIRGSRRAAHHARTPHGRAPR